MKRAIALCGGGTKGAYELGVWRALRELGIEYHIVTGTSIGAINGALMASGDYDKACELWETIRLEDVMTEGLNLTTTIEGMYNQRESIRPFLKKYVKNKGADISPFIEFIDRMVDEGKVRESRTDYGLVTVQVSSMKAMELRKDEIPQGKLKDFIMASASVFPIFPMHKIDGETYLDGCYYDNLPIDLAFKMGADEVIAVDLHTSPSHPAYMNKPYVTCIIPSRSLGTILNFDRKVIEDNIELGYWDALKTFGKVAGKNYTFYPDGLPEFSDVIQAFASRVARTESYLTEGIFNRFIKPGDSKKLCGNIEEHIRKNPGAYTKEDYFLGAAEICGKIFGLAGEQPWHIGDFIREIFGKLGGKDHYPDIFLFHGRKGRDLVLGLAELKQRAGSDYMAACMYYGYLEGEIDLKEQLNLLARQPYELTAALFLLTVKERYGM